VVVINLQMPSMLLSRGSIDGKGRMSNTEWTNGHRVASIPVAEGWHGACIPSLAGTHPQGWLFSSLRRATL